MDNIEGEWEEQLLESAWRWTCNEGEWEEMTMKREGSVDEQLLGIPQTGVEW